jgi:heat shock protein HtpX
VTAVTADAGADQRAADRDRRELLLLALPAGAVLLLGLLLVFAVGPAALVVAAVLAAALVALALFGADRIVLAAIGARPADPDALPRYHNLVHGLCLDAGIAEPRLLLIEASAPNALAFGSTPRHSTIAVTTGLLEGLNLVELEGVLGHQVELIRGHGARLRTVAVVLGGLAPALWYRGGLWRVLAWLAAPLVPLQRLLDQGAIQTEADERGALLTRYPPGLVHALVKVADQGQAPASARAVAHLWLVEPARPAAGDEPGWLWSGLDSRPLDERLSELREL